MRLRRLKSRAGSLHQPFDKMAAVLLVLFGVVALLTTPNTTTPQYWY
jgi:hypothetical protein